MASDVERQPSSRKRKADPLSRVAGRE